MAAAHHRAVRMLGLGTDPAAFEGSAAGLALGALVASRPGLRIPLTADVWESWSGPSSASQVNLAFAYALRRRLTELCGAATASSLQVHPTAAQVAAWTRSSSSRCSSPRSKAEYITAWPARWPAGSCRWRSCPKAPPPRPPCGWRRKRGIGPWTTHYVMMRGCGFGDCVPLGERPASPWLRSATTSWTTGPRWKETAALMAPYAPHGAGHLHSGQPEGVPA